MVWGGAVLCGSACLPACLLACRPAAVHTTLHCTAPPAALQGMEGLVAEVGRSHACTALELEGRQQREAALQREVARQRAALSEAGNRIR